MSTKNTKTPQESSVARQQPIDFEASLKQLEVIAAQLEAEDVGLNDAMALYEQGMRLVKNCQKILQTAEQKVEILTQENGTPHVKDLDLIPGTDDQ